MDAKTAWRTISHNLADYYKTRRTPTYPGYDHTDTQAEVIAFKALQEMAEREENKPLKLSDLKQMEGEPVWVRIICKTNFADPQDAFNAWGLVRSSWVRVWDKDRADIITVKHVFENYGKTWLAYRHKPTNNQK